MDTILSLLEAPAPTQVHAGFLAAARELAASDTRTGDDPIGRRGIILQLQPRRNGTLIINPASGALLANTTSTSNVGGLYTYLAAGLVNSSTALPQGFPPVSDHR